MPKSHFDWLAIASLWIGAVIEALNAGSLPLVTGAPAWLASDVWKYVPVLLVSFYFLVALYRQVKPVASKSGTVADKSEPSSPARVSRIIEHVGSGPSTAVLPTLPASGNDPTLERSTERPSILKPNSGDREYIPERMTLSKLREMIEHLTGAQAARLVQPYLNKWMRISGPLADISPMYEGRGASLRMSDTLEVKYSTLPLHIYFDSGYSKLELLERGQFVAVEGQLVRLSRGNMELDHCELLHP